MTIDRIAHWGTCSNDECLTSVVIYPHPEAHRPLPDEKAWDSPLSSTDCPVCGVSMDWGGTDHPADIIKNYPQSTQERMGLSDEEWERFVRSYR